MENLIIIGNVGGNAEVKKINTAKVINFSVACKYKEQTTWYECAWWRNADDDCNIAQYIAKGTKIAVVGRPSARAYKAKDGEVKASLGIQVERIELLTKAEESSDSPF